MEGITETIMKYKIIPGAEMKGLLILLFYNVEMYEAP